MAWKNLFYPSSYYPLITFGSGIQKWMHHDVSEAKKAFVVAALLAFGWAIVTALFRSAGMSVIDISS